MPKILFIKKKIGNSYLVWFQNSNSYLQLEEPAWFVFGKTIKRCKTESIADEFAIRYDLSFDDSLAFVSEIREKIIEMNEQDNYDTERTLIGLDQHNLTVYSVYQYNLGNRKIKFSYGTDWLENYIHPLISHLETSDKINEVANFELFEFQERVVFRLNNEIKGTWCKEDSNFVKGKIFMELINEMHHKTDADWLMTVHASAITNGKKTVLFSAAPGSGKTTIAALLQAHGYQLISDDFVPIDQTFLAYPFPIAMSVKEGSMELLTSHYPVLEQKPLNFITKEKRVRYLPAELKMMGMTLPVHEFVFIKYDKNLDFNWEKLEPIKAVKLLMEQTWIPPEPENVKILFSKILNASFYQLTYSNTKKALNAIDQLFENE